MAIRYDRASVTAPEETPEGFWRCDASIGSVGVFAYRRADGSIQREYRPAVEVFHADSIASALGKPATVGHPGMVNAKSVRAHRVGGLLGTPRADGAQLLVRMQLDDDGAVARARAGELRDISPGYNVREDRTPGVHPEFGPYDLVQREIRYNHFALLPPGAGRQGSAVGLRLDAADAIAVDAGELVCEAITVDTALAAGPRKIAMRIGEIEIKLDAAEEVKLAAVIAALAAARDKAEAECAALTVRADAAEKIVASAARAELEASARTVLGAAEKFDGKSDRDVLAAVVAKAFPAVSLEGKSDVYVKALFDAALAQPRVDDKRVSLNAQLAAAVQAGGPAVSAVEQAKRDRILRIEKQSKGA